MKNIYNKLKHIAVCTILVATVSSCENDIEDIGGAQQNLQHGIRIAYGQ